MLDDLVKLLKSIGGIVLYTVKILLRLLLWTLLLIPIIILITIIFAFIWGTL